MRASWLALGLGVVMWPVGGCAMHGGMAGMHGGGEPAPASAGGVVALVETAGLRVSVEVPAVHPGETVRGIVSVRSAPAGEPVSGAEVVVTPPEGAAVRAHETSRGGVYEALLRFDSRGPHDVAVAVRAGDDPARQAVVTVRILDGRAERHGGGIPAAVVVAGVAMVVMMTWMVARGTGF